MRYARAGLAAAGLILAVGAGAWRYATPSRTADLPARLDRTAVAGGSYTLYAGPTGAPKRVPDRRTLTLVSRSTTVHSTGTTALLTTDTRATIGADGTADARRTYEVDRRTHALVGSGDYVVALPPDTGSGPYRLDVDVLGATVTLHRDGAPVEAGGLTLVPLRATERRVPLSAADAARIGGRGLSGLSLRALAGRLPTGFDPRAFATQVYPRLSAADKAAVGPYLTRNLPVAFSADIDLRLLVEPRTGLIVAVDRLAGTLYARPDLRAVAPLRAILGRQAYAGIPQVAIPGVALGQAIQRPPTITLAAAYVSQTPASVAETAGYAAARRAELGRPSPAGPLALGAAGLLLLVGALGWKLVAVPAGGAARHRRGDRTACVQWARPVERAPTAAAGAPLALAATPPRHALPAAPAPAEVVVTRGAPAGVRSHEAVALERPRRSWTVSRPRRPFRKTSQRLSEQYRVLLPPRGRD